MGQGLVIRSLNILLGLFFMFLGSLKITPNIIRDLHKDLRSEYAKYAKVGRLAAAGLTWPRCSPSPRASGTRCPPSGTAGAWGAPRSCVVRHRARGGTHQLQTTSSGLVLLLVPNRRLRNVANVVLLLTKVAWHITSLVMKFP